ncbi:class I SAM-dependent methyltransferase [Leekyejoonella antrihumi]|uniref:Class I SAM-dependent methyltransferase n=1 Tax=Leekyejoonella antrihumi TaxID=1660198 RepID=A0A563E284_9MICO|nr:class I SAM-dependent methyltransferase [Leekyejoonella antrihumi]TWP36660.1 class I SAM-dependent methyltransferase [Leekyejoonella antrihumi]
MGNTDDGRWHWDSSLYSGSAAYYARGRAAYPAALIDLLVADLGLDGRGRLLDIGCGPGSLTLPLASHVGHAVGVDADRQMLAEGERQARRASVVNVEWIHRRAEDLSGELGRFNVATMAQSFHWMDRDRVAGLFHGLLVSGGVVAFVHATTHEGVVGTVPLPHPRPPRPQIDALVADYLGERRRAGSGYRNIDVVSEDERGRLEARIIQAAGFTGPTRREIPGWVENRTVDDVVASVFSLSYAAPHLFGQLAGQFEHDLRQLLSRVSPIGKFSEQMREIAVDLWRA